MSWLRNISRGIGYVINPLGAVIDYFQGVPDPSTGKLQQSGFSKTKTSLSDWWNSKAKPFLSNIWDDLTGKSQITYQNELQRQLAEEEYQRNIDAIEDTASAYEAAGFNPNIMYGGSNGSPVSYSAPELQSYSGSKKLDAILQRTGAVLNMIPAIYQATAALEGIDQARERTKQSEIKTMSMGMSLLDQGYKLGDSYLSHPFSFDFGQLKGGKRHVFDSELFPANSASFIPDFRDTRDEFQRYADASLKNKFDLLNAIGIKNQMNSTLNSWRGYQYDLDRRFGAAGRIVGMASQGARAASSLFSPIKLPTNLYRR